MQISFVVLSKEKNLEEVNLSYEHGSRRNLHVVAKFEVLQKGDPLFHTYVSIHFKAHISNWVPWVYVPNDIFCNHIESWRLQKKFASVRKLK